MSWRDAPLYVRCHDLARDLLPRLDGSGSAPLRAALGEGAVGLLCAVSEGLSFPGPVRVEAQARADRHVADLKVLVRLAADLGIVSAGGARHLGAELVEIGRMLGGWRRRQAGPPRAAISSGAAPPLGQALDPGRELER